MSYNALSDAQYQAVFGQRFQLNAMRNYLGWGADKSWIPPIYNPQTVSELFERHNLAANAFSLLSNIG